MTAPATAPLTETTWATLAADRAYLSADYAQRARLHWPALVDLGRELAARTGLPEADARVLVDLCVAGLPVILTWTQGRETVTAAVLVELVSTDAVRVRYVGFGHWVNLADVRSARVFDTVVTFA